jgi:hypothetical protein
MDGPSRATRTRNILAAGVIAVAIAMGGYLVGRGSVEAPPPPVPKTPAPVREPKPEALPDILLERGDLIRLAAAAADAVGGGPTTRDDLAGRRFVVRLPFGCAGPTENAEIPFGWSYNAEQQTLRVRITPQQWIEAPWVAERMEEHDIESVEGFWVPRPWTSSESCPPEAPTIPDERSSSLGIAQFFGTDSSRVGQRRGKALQLVERVPPDRLQFGSGFHLLLEGRIASVPGGQGTVLCHAAEAYDRPTCLIAAEFVRVAIENPATQEVLAEWQL